MGSDITRTKYNIRKDPFTLEDQSILIEHELFTIPAASLFYIELEEIPREESPSTVLIYLTDVLAEDVDISEDQIDVGDGDRWEVDNVILVDNEQMLIGGKAGDTISVTRHYGGTSAATHTNGTRFRKLTPWTEVYTAPSAGEYQVHYGTAAIPYRKGLVRFNEDDAEKEIWVDYYGTGFGNMAEHLNDIQDELNKEYTAGDLLLASADIEKYTSSLLWIKAKEILLPRRGGTLRIKFDMKGSYSHARIYRNGIVVGIDHGGTPDYITFSEDISGWNPNDLCQLYYCTASGVPTYVKNFRIYAGWDINPKVTLD